MGPSPNWRVPLHSTFHWREWDSEFVVYHENSGDTHRLNAVGASALKHLIGRSMSADELVPLLAREFDLEAGPELTTTIGELIARFADLGLIEREIVPPP